MHIRVVAEQLDEMPSKLPYAHNANADAHRASSFEGFQMRIRDRVEVSCAKYAGETLPACQSSKYADRVIFNRTLLLLCEHVTQTLEGEEVTEGAS